MEADVNSARRDLDIVQKTQVETKRSVTAEITCKYLILWGAAWSLAYVLTHFYLIESPGWYFRLLSVAGVEFGINIIWFVLMGVAGLGQWIMVRKDLKAGAVRPIRDSKVSKKIFWFWALLFGYSFTGLVILSPESGIQVNAFLGLTVMFAYIMMGMWSGERLMVLIGLIVTVNILIGYFVIPAGMYSLWMAVAAGGVLFGAGLWGQFMWKVRS